MERLPAGTFRDMHLRHLLRGVDVNGRAGRGDMQQRLLASLVLVCRGEGCLEGLTAMTCRDMRSHNFFGAVVVRVVW